MTVIIDYGVGNLFSLLCSLNKIGEECSVSSDPEVIKNAERLILPGVGAFEDAIKKLEATGLVPVIKDFRGPILGICLGMQLLFEESLEYGCHKGLGLLPGSVVPLEGKISKELKIPHMGWNALEFRKASPLFKYISEGDYVYFVHSFYASCPEGVISSVSDYSIPVTGSVEKDNIYGTQFHPEKSGDVGLKILKAFCEI